MGDREFLRGYFQAVIQVSEMEARGVPDVKSSSPEWHADRLIEKGFRRVEIQHAWKLGARTTWCGDDRNPSDPSHRASESPEEADSRPLCIKCHRALARYWSERSGRRSTHWLPISEIGWVDRITGKARRERDKKIEVVVHHGEILVSDDESGTHRMIPTDNILDFRFGVFE